MCIFSYSYPLDAKVVEPSLRANKFTTADDDILRELALAYAEQYPDMHSGRGCGRAGTTPTHFPSGVSNGAGWRERHYSLQDYTYLDLNILTITPRISCCYYVSDTGLPKLFKDNEASLLAVLDKARQAVKGDISSELKVPLRNAYLNIHGRNTVINVTKDYGSFYRVLPQGTFKLIAHAPGYSSIIKEVTVGPEVGENTLFMLNKVMTKYNYNDPAEMEGILTELSQHCSQIMRLYTIGKTVKRSTDTSGRALR